MMSHVAECLVCQLRLFTKSVHELQSAAAALLWLFFNLMVKADDATRLGVLLVRGFLAVGTFFVAVSLSTWSSFHDCSSSRLVGG